MRPMGNLVGAILFAMVIILPWYISGPVAIVAYLMDRLLKHLDANKTAERAP
jgi:hypothetical protein